MLAGIASSHAQASELKPLYAAAIAEAQRAIELAPTLPDGHLALGYARFAGNLDIRGAKPSYDKAYRYGQGNADIVLLFALYIVLTRVIPTRDSLIEPGARSADPRTTARRANRYASRAMPKPCPSTRALDSSGNRQHTA